MSFEKQALRAAVSVQQALPYDVARFLKGPLVGDELGGAGQRYSFSSRT